jgi:hypothetical protein
VKLSLAKFHSSKTELGLREIKGFKGIYKCDLGALQVRIKKVD